jgi:hypothetical protein
VDLAKLALLLFEGNQCLRSTPGQLFGFIPDVDLLMRRGNVCCNTVEAINLTGLTIRGAELVVNANTVRAAGTQTGGFAALSVFGFVVGGVPAGAIVTSNLTSGLSTNSTGQLLRINNIPP